MRTYDKNDKWKDEELHNTEHILSELLNNKKLPDTDAETLNIITELLADYSSYETEEDLKKALIYTVKDLGFIIDKLNNDEIKHTYSPNDYWKGAELRAAARIIGEVANHKGLHNKDKKTLLPIAELLTGYYEFKTHEDLKNQLIKTVDGFKNII
jgi:hypothetical protein